MIKFLDLKKQYESIQTQVDNAIRNVIMDSAFIGGKYVERFEREFADYIGAHYCLGVANGTDALEIALWSLNLPKGSEVLVPANTFIATAEAVSRNGLVVRFIDCGEDYTMDIASLEAHMTPNTSALIAVHLYGQACNMHEILEIAKTYRLKVIEDCAQAHGATYKDQKVGTFGDIATFSFYPGKNLGAYGDGGAIVTNDKSLFHKCQMYANHGRSSQYGHEFEGINSRLDGIQAAVLSVKLPYLDQWIKQRRTIAQTYMDALKDISISLPLIKENVGHVWHLFVISATKRDELITYLKEHNIQCGIHYHTALPKLKAYEGIRQDCSHFKACKEDKTLLSLPMGEHLEKKDILCVASTIKAFLHQGL